MKKLYTLALAFAAILFSATAISQPVPVYATSQTGTSGAEITSTANGPATYMGDQIVLAGTERILDNIVVRVFNLASDAPFTLTMRLYTDCMSTAAGCDSGPGTMIAGSEVVVPVTPSVGIGTIFTVTIPFNGLDIYSESDNSIAVMMNASRNDVFWVLNETVVTGSTPAGEGDASAVIRCASVVAANNGCTRAFTNAINNFSMIVNANVDLGLEDPAISSSVILYPNPSDGLVNISLPSGIRKVSVMDMTGRILRETLYDHETDIKMNLTSFSSGNYNLKVESADGTVIKKYLKL